ncbi:MAG: Alanine transaminase, partial [uncultured Actinomycetospora sp.]
GVPAVEQAARRLLRDPRPGGRAGEPARGGGAQRPAPQHGQPRAVRLRGARGDRPGHDPDAPPGARLHRLPRGAAGAPRGGPALPGARARRGRRRGVPRQRRLRADLHGRPGARRGRRRGARADAGLSPVDRGRDARRRPRRALPLRRAGRLVPRPRRRRRQDHRPHQGARDHQPEQPDGRGVLEGGPRGPARPRPPARADGHGGRDLRPGALRRRRAPRHRLAGRGPRRADVLRAVEDPPRRGVPLRLAGGHRPAPARPRLPRGPGDAGLDAPVREHARAVRHPGRARRAADDPRADRARRAPARAARHRVEGPQRDPRGLVRAAARRALRLPAPRPRRLPDPRRRAVRARPAARGEDPGRAGHGLQLAHARPLPHPHAPPRRDAG